jgi:hypothetical protein
VTVEITLSPAELACASTVAALRHYSSTIRGGRDAHGLKRQVDASCHYDGACAELAAARALGVYWPASVNSYGEPDLPPDWQVRGRSRHDYDLLVRPGDSDDHRFVLVTGTAPSLRVVGWCYGKEAKRGEFKRAYGGRPEAFFVPASSLRSI